jgi:thiamine biosynthesis lipoprotein
MTGSFDGGERFERRAMGSPLRLTIVGVEAALATRGWELVSDEFEAAEQAMSRFRESSDLTTVNRAAGDGRCRPVDRRLSAALVAADRAGRVTGGRFDARVLADLERLGYAGASLEVAATGRSGDRPTGPPGAGETAKNPATGRWLAIDGRASEVALERPVDLGGIGKGLALRWAWRRLERAGFIGADRGALLEAGGDLVAGGPAPQGGPWIIALEDPTGDAVPVATVALPGGAVATSSILVHRWTAGDGRAIHHLVDPLTGEPGGAGLLSVTVAGPDPAWAEVWSKTLFLSGAGGIADAARARGLAAWWVRDDRVVEMTAAARARTTWLVTEA